MAGAEALALKRALTDARGLAAALGLKTAVRRGPRAKVLVACPWHSENEPSCSLSPGDDGTLRVRCFGCGVTGDALTLIAEVNSLDAKRDFRKVLVEAARIAGVRVDEPHRTVLSAPAATPSRPLPDTCARESVRAMGRVLLHVGRLDASPIAEDVSVYLRKRFA